MIPTTLLPIVHPALLLTCKQIYPEALSIFYAENCCFLCRDALRDRVLEHLHGIEMKQDRVLESFVFAHTMGRIFEETVLVNIE